jgi:HEAT repeat protein
MNTVRIAALFLAVLAVFPVRAQDSNSSGGNRQMSVEESYLQDPVEMMIIREQSRSGSREMKMVALQYINDAIDRGNTGEEVRAALEFMTMEGVVNKSYDSGRLINNYPDVRTKAATYLGKLGTPEAKDTLIKIVKADNEPMVIQEAIKSLAAIGLNENEETAGAIVWAVRHFGVLNPDNLLALSALDAFEKLAEANGGIKDVSAVQTIIDIADGPYILSVKKRAREVLGNLRKYNAQSQQNQR